MGRGGTWLSAMATGSDSRRNACFRRPAFRNASRAGRSRWSSPAAAAAGCKQLTDRRAKPAVFFGGKFRIIDFVLSNCINSDIRRIAVLTQYKAHSLLRHLQMGWSFLRPEMNEFLDLLPAQQRLDEATWYRGTADAVFQNFDILKAARPEYFVVLAGDHIYKMDYSNMLADHAREGRGLHRRLRRGADRAKRPNSASWRSTSRCASSISSKSRASPPSMPGKPDRCAGEHGHLCVHRRFPLCRAAARPRRPRDRATISART